MELSRKGWLERLLARAVAEHDPKRAPGQIPPEAAWGSAAAAARHYLQSRLRETGLLYGTPLSGGVPGEAAPEEALFYAVLSRLAELGLDLAALLGASRSAERSLDQLAVLFAVFAGEAKLALRLDRDGAQGRGALYRHLSKLERLLEKRAVSLSGDPVFGLPLHNGALYADARAFGRTAIRYLQRGTLDERSTLRRLAYATREKALLVEVLCALARAERVPSYPAQRAILRQIEDLGLPADKRRALKRRVRGIFRRPPSPQELALAVRTPSMRHFLLEQTVLASLVDGRRSQAERDFLQRLGTAFGVGPDDLARIELQLAEFYAKNRHFVDAFTVKDAATALSEEMVGIMTEAVELNLDRVMREVRETGELAELLAKAARGATLSGEEKRKVKAQLLDVAKAVPALAIFAAPGGVLLLIALAKVLPFNLLPSSFTDEAELPPEAAEGPGGSFPPARR